MVFVPIIHQPPLLQTRHSRELGLRFDEAVREYKRQHPDLTDVDVRTALAVSLQKVGSPEDEARQRKLAIFVLVAIALVFMGVALAGGSSDQDSEGKAFLILGVVAAVGGIAIAAIRIARRD